MRKFKDIPENEKWYIAAPQDNDGNIQTKFAIVDGDGYTVVNMTYMTESVASEICRLHNYSLISEDQRVKALTATCKDVNALFSEIMPQAGKLVFQDHALLNETLMALDALESNNG